MKKYKGKIKYVVLTVAPVDYCIKKGKKNFRLCTIDENGILWIAGMTGRLNKYNTANYFLCRRDAENAVIRTRRYQKKIKMLPTVHHIIPITQFP